MNAIGNYRSDIDGLRAIAVFSVIFYHLEIGGIKGGFVGVDIFFVISGYLITKIINTEIEQEKFSFVNFYERRIRRIFPALFVIIGVSLLLGAFVLLPHDLVLLARATWATLLFGSNVLFWRRSGYFDSTAELNPLLHTWSLAVEEQFYVLYPIMLIAIHRYMPSLKHTIFFLAILVTLGVCIYFQPIRPTATFFLAPFRAWELLTGALLAMRIFPAMQTPASRELAAWTGLILLVASIIFTRPGVDFPGWQAMIPVLGTALLIYVGGIGGATVNTLLSRKPVVFVGLISYSLYLWHWPLIAYLKYIDHDDVVMRWGLLPVLITAAYASYRWVEQPFRIQKKERKRPAAGKAVMVSGGVGATCLAVMAFVAQIDNGHLARLPAPLAELNSSISPEIPYKDCSGKPVVSAEKNSCTIGVTSSVNRVLVWGDSHALAWAPGLNQVFKRNGVQGVLAIHSACPPLFGVINPVSFGCASFNNDVMDWLGKGPVKHVVMIASWLSYSMESGQYAIQDAGGRIGNKVIFPSALEKTVSNLRNAGIHVTIMAPTPGAPDDVVRKVLMARLRGDADPLGRSCASFKKDSANFMDAVAAVDRSGLDRVIDPSAFFCGEGGGGMGFAAYMNSNSELLYRDGGHLSVLGAIFAAESVENEIMDRILPLRFAR